MRTRHSSGATIESAWQTDRVAATASIGHPHAHIASVSGMAMSVVVSLVAIAGGIRHSVTIGDRDSGCCDFVGDRWWNPAACGRWTIEHDVIDRERDQLALRFASRDRKLERATTFVDAMNPELRELAVGVLPTRSIEDSQ